MVRFLLGLGRKILKLRPSILLLALSFMVLVFYPKLAKTKVISTNLIDNQATGIINSIYQGDTSLWIGGEKGLFRVIGQEELKITIESHGFKSEVRDILQDQNSRIWVSSKDEMLSYFDPVNQKFVRLNINNADNEFGCWDLTLRKDGSLIVACGHNIYLVNTEELSFSNVLDGQSEDNLKGIKKVTTDKQGHIWFSTYDSSIYILELTNRTISKFNEGGLDQKYGKVTALNSDSLGSVWIATVNGVVKYEPLSKKTSFYSFPSGSENIFISSIYEDVSGGIWFAGNTLYNFENDSLIVSDSFYPVWRTWDNSFINSVTESKQGVLHLAANLNGVISLPKSKEAIKFLTDGNLRPIKSISYSFVHRKNLYFADGKDLYSAEVDGGSPELIVKDLGYINKALMLNDDTAIFSLDRKGLWLMNMNNFGLKRIASRQLGLPTDMESDIYAITSLGGNEVVLGYFGDVKRGIYKGSFNDGFSLLLKDVYVDELIKIEDTVIFATRKEGIIELNKRGDLTKWRNIEGHQRITTNCLKQDFTGVIWICTNGNGLGFLDQKTRTIQFVDPKYTNNSNLIRDLVEDSEQNLWLMTGNGLVRYSPKTQRAISLGKEDGIYDVDFEITASANLGNDQILVAGDLHNYIINTRKMNRYLDKRSQLTTNVVMTDLSISRRGQRVNEDGSSRLNRAILENAQLSFEYEEYLFSIKFAANNFIERENLGFEYRLKGLDKTWTRTKPSEASATYSTLPHGYYEFQVRVYDPKSQVEQPVLALPIHVLPPLWLTWQAYLFYLLSFVFALYLAYQYRTRKLKLTNDYLASQISERTKQLEKSNTTVNNLLKQKEKFFENLSHEFRTPITLIRGPLEKMKRTDINKTNARSLAIISRNSHRLESLVDQLLELTKTNDFSDSEKVVYSVNPCLELLLESFVPLATTKNLTFKLKNTTRAILKLHHDSFEKIVSNLLSNAIKYTSSKGTVEVRSYDSEGFYILEVRDNGPGIPATHHKKVFERYVRCNSTSDIEGTGLGLALTKELVETNGGKISLKSESEKGANFVVSFPIDPSIKPPIPAIELEEIEPSKLIEEPASSQSFVSDENEARRRILIIEDNKDMTTYIVKSLSKAFDCYHASNGEEGIDRAFELVPDMIITDLMMPKKDGFEVVDAIRENEITSHIPIILLTAKGDKDSRLCGWNKNVDDYISKPFVAEELLARVNSLIKIREIIRFKLVHNGFSSKDPANKYSFKSAKDRVFFEKFVEVIKKHYPDEAFNRGKAAACLAMSERQLNRKLSALIDYNFSEYLKKYRLEQAKEQLLKGGQITEVSYNVGFSSPSYFTSCFKAEFGQTPKAYIESEVGLF